SPLSACFAHSRGSTACAFAIAGETCSKSCTARHLAASIGLPQTSSYSAATIRRTVSTTMSRARSSLTQGIRCAGKARDERHEKLVAHPVHHEIVEVNGISDTGREKQSGRHETSLISRYWKPAAITAASFTQIFPPLFGCLCDPRARRKLASCLKIERHRRLHGWTEQTG